MITNSGAVQSPVEAGALSISDQILEDFGRVLEGFCPFDNVRLEQRGSPGGGHCPVCGKDYRAYTHDEGRPHVRFSQCECPDSSAETGCSGSREAAG